MFSLLNKSHGAPAIRGLRVDPGYFYDLYPSGTVATISKDVVAKAQAAGVNTLYIYAYNTVYGAFYPTTYSMTIVEGTYGKANIFAALTAEAKLKGMKVIAVLPVNNFKKVWSTMDAWKVKTKTLRNYKPYSDVFLLSAWHPDFRTWLKGFYTDFLVKNPNVDGIEGVEPMIDYNWNMSVDYNPKATAEFQKRYPNNKLGDATWKNFRAQGLTELIGIMSQQAHAYGKISAIVQTWAALKNGSLYSNQEMSDGMGFNFDQILNLTGTSKVDWMMSEFMWQQWAAEYGGTVFNPQWTRTVSMQFISFVNNRSTPIIHVEISPFSGPAGDITPTNAELTASMKSVYDIAPGVDVYDHFQIESNAAWTALLDGWK